MVKPIASVVFAASKHGPERLVSEAEVRFEEGPLAGTRLLGFCLWRNAAGELYVTFPSRATSDGGERRYFDYLRSLDGKPETLRRIKAWILEEYRSDCVRANALGESARTDQ